MRLTLAPDHRDVQLAPVDKLLDQCRLGESLVDASYNLAKNAAASVDNARVVNSFAAVGSYGLYNVRPFKKIAGRDGLTRPNDQPPGRGKSRRTQQGLALPLVEGCYQAGRIVACAGFAETAHNRRHEVRLFAVRPKAFNKIEYDRLIRRRQDHWQLVEPAHADLAVWDAQLLQNSTDSLHLGQHASLAFGKGLPACPLVGLPAS
jgi:hypothetical protein